ncbi:MAG: glycosyltransferase family 4 protein [Bacteroides sp.]|nr:glycosyltransferase family 4 protein [Bacteroides sp.]
MRKKTLIHILSGNRWGGVERYALDICRHFISEGWEVAVVTRDAKAVDTLFEKEGVKLLHAPIAGMFDPATVNLLLRTLRNSEEDSVTIHTHGFRNAFNALLARKISGRKDIRIVMTRHKVKKGIDSWLFRRIYRNLDAIICVSQLAADRFISTWRGKSLPFPIERLHILHNSLNLHPATPLPRQGKGPVCAMFHGQLIPGKGLETLIDAMSLLKGTRLRLKIVGSGTPDYVDRLRRRAITRGVMESIDWHKYSDEPLNLISESDFGVLPSQVEEACGMANIEYMACGRPQVCSANGAQPEYITDGREGFLVTPGNPARLAEAMRKLASDTATRIRMGERAFSAFRNNLSWDSFIAALTPLYQPVRD